MRPITLLPILLALGALGACSPRTMEERTAERMVQRADSVGIAMSEFDIHAFDTIGWASDQVAEDRGALVFRISCEKCHGPLGQGDGGFVLHGDTLSPPSFRQPNWGFASAPIELREYIYSGNVAGMPYWGLVGLTLRDIDAVARYISGPMRHGV